MANQIDLIIKATNKASPEIQKVQKDLGGLSQSAGSAGMSLNGMFKGLAAVQLLALLLRVLCN